MAVPDAVLSAFIEAKGARQAVKDVVLVDVALEECRKTAVRATAAVEKFGRMRGVAVLDVDAAKARAATAAATKEVNGFDRVNATAVLEANGSRVTREVVKVSDEVKAFGALTAEARADLKTAGAVAKIGQLRALIADLAAQDPTVDVQVRAAKAVADLERTEAGLAKMRAEIRRSGQAVDGLGGNFDGLRQTKGQADKVIDRNIGTFAALAQKITGTSSSTVALRGSLGPLSGGLGVVASSALLLGTGLLAIVGPAIAVAAALAPLAGLGAGVAGGLVAAATGFGVFKLATAGVGDALKEQTKLSAGAGNAALSQAGQEVAAARSIRAAQEGLRAAKEATARASQGLDEATRNERVAVAALGPAFNEARARLRDLRDTLTTANLSLREARFAAADAAKALKDLLSGPSPRALADAHRQVTDSLRGERDAARDLADAHKALNDLLSPAAPLDLADANDAVSDALRGQTAAQIALARQVEATNAVLADPNATALDQADARARLADAENAVGDAARQTQHVKEALAKLEAGPSQQEIARARDRVADAEDAVAQATQRTADAKRDEAKVAAGPSDDEIARARLALAQAQDALSGATKDATRAQREFYVAEAAGLSLSPSVLAAREALRSAALAGADAERGLTEAQRQEVIAARGVHEAQQDAARSAALAAGAAVALGDKLSSLPAPAQAFVRQLIAMKPLLTDLRATAAGGFFPGAGEGLTAAARNFEPLRRVVAATSLVLGDLARRAGELVGGAAFGRDIETIGTRNAKVLDTMGSAVLHVVSALRHVLVAAGPLTQWLADVADKWALNAAEAAKAGRESGKLADFFDRAKATAQRLGSILGHLGSGLLGLGGVAAVTGRDILASIDKAAARFDEWANSVRGQSEIREFFEKTKEIAAALLPALANLAKGFGFLALKLLPVTAALKLLGPYADEAVVAFVAYKLAVTAATLATTLYSGAVFLAGTRIGAAILYMIAWRASQVAATVATGALAAAQWLLNAALTANPIGLIVVGLAALVAGLIYAYKHSETFRDIVDGAFRAVADAFGWLLQAAQDVFGWLKSHWVLVLSILTGPIGAAVIQIATHADEIVAFFKALPGRILDAIKSGASFFVSAVGWVKDQIVNGIKAYLSLYVGVGLWVVNRFIDGIKATAGAIADAAGWLKNRVVDGVHAVVAGFIGLGGWVLNRIVDGFRIVSEALAAVGGWLRNRVVEIVHGAADGFVGLGGWILNRVVDGFRVVTDALAAVGGWLKNRVSDAFDAAKDGFVSLGGTIIGWIVDGLKDGANLLVSFVNKVIDLINKIPGVDIDHVRGFAQGGEHSTRTAAATAQGFAHGGAFARTGGFVNQPITLMGEEAPHAPEWVIPTNKAYRGRALKLWQAAGRSIGAFATGGIYSAADMANLAQDVGAQNPPLMGAIGKAESGGNPRAVGPQTSGGRARGLWQILWPLHAASFPGLDPFVPRDNARMMKSIQSSQGLGAWEAYTNGAYRQFLPGSGSAGTGLNASGDAGGSTGILGAVGGILGDLISGGAGFLLRQLPGVGDLPDWLHGTGRYVLDHVGDWIKDKVSGLVSGGDGSYTPGSIPAGSSAHDALMAMQRAGEAINARHFPYVYGGGHNGSFSGPYDCSGLVSAILHSAGLLSSPITTDGLKNFGVAGHGNAVTIGVRGSTGRQAHTMMQIGSRYIESGSGHGAQWVNGWAPPGFDIYRHPPGLAQGGVYGDVMGRIVDPDVLGWGLRQGGQYGGGLLGSFAAGTDYVPRTGPYMLHQGESVTPAGGDTFEIQIGVKGGGPLERVIADMIDVRIVKNGRELDAEWRAGRLP